MPRTTIRTDDVNAAADIAQSKLATIAADALSGNMIDGGTISNFASTGIDDNADATAITIDSSEQVGIQLATTPAAPLHVKVTGSSGTETEVVRFETTGHSDASAVVTDYRTAHTRGEINLVDGTGSYDSNIVFKTATGSLLAAPTEKMRIAASGNMQMTGSGSVGISYATLADDSVTSFTPGSDRGMIFAGGDSTHMGAVGYVCKNGGTTETYLLLNTAGTFGVGTGIPTGTTGTGVRFNIFAANDGKIYFENRLGGGFTFWYFTMGLPW